MLCLIVAVPSAYASTLTVTTPVDRNAGTYDSTYCCAMPLPSRPAAATPSFAIGLPGTTITPTKGTLTRSNGSRSDHSGYVGGNLGVWW